MEGEGKGREKKKREGEERRAEGKKGFLPTCTTEVTEVRVTLSDSQEAWTVLGVTGTSAAATPRKPVWAVQDTLAVLLTEVV